MSSSLGLQYDSGDTNYTPMLVTLQSYIPSQVDNSGFEHEHVIGDLTYIQPTRFFDGFESNTRTEIPLVIEHWSVQETDNMPVRQVHDEICTRLCYVCPA